MINFCKKCNNGLIWDEKNNCYKDCTCKKLFILSKKNNLKYSRANISDVNSLSYDSFKANNMITKIDTIVNKWETNFNSLHQYWHGPQGTCKSSFSKLLLKQLINKYNITGYYMFAKDFAQLITLAEMNPNAEYKLNKILNCDLLILDEFQEDRLALYKSGWKEKQMVVSLKTRLEVLRKATIFISNDTIEETYQNSLGELLANMIDRETKKCRLEFTQVYTNVNLNKEIEDLWS